jgi:hypothetical protein
MSKFIHELTFDDIFESNGKLYVIKNFKDNMVEVKESKTGKLFAWPNTVIVRPIKLN